MKVPQSDLRSYSGNITARLIRVRDNKVISYSDALGNSLNSNDSDGGKEALSDAGKKFSQKIIDVLKKGDD